MSEKKKPREAKRIRDLTEDIAKLLQENGIDDDQTAFDVACDLEPVVTRLIQDNRDVVTV